MTDRELMQQALEVLIFNQASWQRKDETVNALRDRLAQSEQGPVAWQGVHDHTDLYYRKPPQADVRPLYTNPPAQPSPVLQQAYSTSAAYTVGFKDGQATQRQWVGLTDEEIRSLNNWWPSYNDKRSLMVLIRDAEAKLKEKNT